MTGEYRMTMDPSEKDALLRVPGDLPMTNAETPKAGATVQPMIPGAVLISVPLTAYGDHKVTVYTRVVGKDGRVVQMYEDPIQGPAPLYTKVLPIVRGTYRVEIAVKDTANGKLAADNIEYEVK